METKQSKKAQNALREVLSFENEKIISYPLRLSKLVKAFENLSWADAQKKANQLTDSNQASDYVVNVREKLITNLEGGNSETAIAPPIENSPDLAEKRAVKKKQKTKQDLPSANYCLLQVLVPDMETEEKIEPGYFALASKRASADIGFEVFHQVDTGVFADLTFYQKTKQEIDIRCSLYFFIDYAAQQVLPLIYSDIKGYRHVYVDSEKREFVNEKERAELDDFLNSSLKNLIKKKYVFAEYFDPAPPVVEEPEELDEVEDLEEIDEDIEDLEALYKADIYFEKQQAMYEKRLEIAEKERFKNTLQALEDYLNEGIPDFYAGAVKFTDVHQKIGLNEKDIAWINEKKRGFVALVQLQPDEAISDEDTTFLLSKVQQVGMRITAHGRILIEGRGIRS